MNNSKRWRSLNDFGGAQNYEYNNNGFQYSKNKMPPKSDQRSAIAYGSSYYSDRKYSSNFALSSKPTTNNNVNNQQSYQSRSRHQLQRNHLRASVDNLLEADRNGYNKYVDQVSGKLYVQEGNKQDHKCACKWVEMKLPLNPIVLHFF